MREEEKKKQRCTGVCQCQAYCELRWARNWAYGWCCHQALLPSWRNEMVWNLAWLLHFQRRHKVDHKVDFVFHLFQVLFVMRCCGCCPESFRQEFSLKKCGLGCTKPTCFYSWQVREWNESYRSGFFQNSQPEPDSKGGRGAGVTKPKLLGFCVLLKSQSFWKKGQFVIRG